MGAPRSGSRESAEQLQGSRLAHQLQHPPPQTGAHEPPQTQGAHRPAQHPRHEQHQQPTCVVSRSCGAPAACRLNTCIASLTADSARRASTRACMCRARASAPSMRDLSPSQRAASSAFAPDSASTCDCDVMVWWFGLGWVSRSSQVANQAWAQEPQLPSRHTATRSPN